MGSKRLDKEAASREGEPILAGAVVRSSRSAKAAILRVIGAVPTVGEYAQSVGEMVPLGEDEPKAPRGMKSLNISLPSRMYLTLSAARLTLYALRGLGTHVGEPVSVVPRNYVRGIAIKRNLTLLVTPWWEYGERAVHIQIAIAAGAPLDMQAGRLQLSDEAVVTLDTGDVKSIKKMEAFLKAPASQ